MTDDATMPLRPRGRQRRRPAYSVEECFANMAMLWRHYGRAPRFEEINRPPSKIGHSPYLRRSGSWMRALESFAQFSGLDVKQTTLEAPPELDAVAQAGTATRLRQRPTRTVRLGLRFQVLQRDRFKCAACGNSPATDPHCKLHVDHIVQWSRGGKTEPGNLRTLCAACNIGRGARAEE